MLILHEAIDYFTCGTKVETWLDDDAFIAD